MSYFISRLLQTKSFLLTFILLAFLLFSLLWGTEDVSAQGSGVAISPLVFEMTGEPGDSIENIVKVLNPSDTSSIDVVMEFELILPTGEEGQVTAMSPEEEDTLSIARWIEADPAEFSLRPGEERFVQFMVNVPEGAEPGGHYAAILAKVGSASGPEGTGVGLAYRIGSLILLTVPGPMVEDLSITDFKAPQYSEYGPIPFEIRLENQGTVHVKPNTLITVTNVLGRKVAEIPVEQRNVLPNATRKMDAEWNETWLWGGRYTATLSGTYGRTGSQLSPETLVFWAFPWKAGVIILVVLLFFIITRKRWGAALRVLFKGDNGQGVNNSGDSDDLNRSENGYPSGGRNNDPGLK